MKGNMWSWTEFWVRTKNVIISTTFFQNSSGDGYISPIIYTHENIQNKVDHEQVIVEVE